MLWQLSVKVKKKSCANLNLNLLVFTLLIWIGDVSNSVSDEVEREDGDEDGVAKARAHW